MRCAYCGQETKGTKEHIVSSGILDLFPECYLTFDSTRGKIHMADPMVKDVCAECNNKRITYIDSYAKSLIGQYFTRNYSEEDKIKIEYDYTMVQKMLLKYAFNDMRSHKLDCSYFDDEILHYLMNESDQSPKDYISILCGLAVNVSPAPNAMFGNLKLRWSKDPILFSNSVIRNIDYETGQIFFSDRIEKEDFPDLRVSYVFRFNSVQFLLLCWGKHSYKIEQNNVVLGYQYPYYLMRKNDREAELPICTDEVNYHLFEHIHVSWDGCFEVGTMRKYASGGKYEFKELYEKEWAKEEERLKEEHSRQ
jgi:hypothetical protein